MRDCHGLAGTRDVAPAVNVALRLPAEVSGQKPSTVDDVRLDPAAFREQAREVRFPASDHAGPRNGTVCRKGQLTTSDWISLTRKVVTADLVKALNSRQAPLPTR